LRTIFNYLDPIYGQPKPWKEPELQHNKTRTKKF